MMFKFIFSNKVMWGYEQLKNNLKDENEERKKKKKHKKKNSSCPGILMCPGILNVVRIFEDTHI